MSFRDDVQADLSVFFSTDEFADPAEYVTVDGQIIATQVIITQVADLGPSSWPGGESNVFSVSINKTHIPTPQNGDTFTIPGDSKTYRVVSVTQDSRYVATVQAVAEYRPRGV